MVRHAWPVNAVRGQGDPADRSFDSLEQPRYIFLNVRQLIRRTLPRFGTARSCNVSSPQVLKLLYVFHDHSSANFITSDVSACD
jgi:hypothetical protein